MTVQQVATVLQVSRAEVYTMLASGRLAGYRQIGTDERAILRELVFNELTKRWRERCEK